MKVALMSDSHDNMDVLHKAVKYCNDQKVDFVLHAGDLVAPFVNRALKNLHAPLTIVLGNNDGETHGLRQMFKGKIFDPPHSLTVGGRRVLMLHAPMLMDVLKESEQYDLVLYGHTHEIKISKGKNLIVNPGELCGWLTGTCSMAL